MTWNHDCKKTNKFKSFKYIYIFWMPYIIWYFDAKIFYKYKYIFEKILFYHIYQKINKSEKKNFTITMDSFNNTIVPSSGSYSFNVAINNNIGDPSMQQVSYIVLQNRKSLRMRIVRIIGLIMCLFLTCAIIALSIGLPVGLTRSSDVATTTGISKLLGEGGA